MQKVLTIILFVFTVVNSTFSQEVKAIHAVNKGVSPNEYTIKTTISGLEGVDIARVSYFISKKHTYKAAASNSLFSNRGEEFVKFYIMAIPTNGILVVDLGVVVNGEGRFDFPVEFQYSKNEEKKVINFNPIVIENGEAVLADVGEIEETPSTETEITSDETTNNDEENEAEKKLVEEEKAKEEAELAAKIEKVRAIAAQEEQAKQEEEAAAKRVEEEERLAQEEAEAAAKAKEETDLTEQSKKEEEAAKNAAEAQLEKGKEEQAAKELAKTNAAAEQEAKEAAAKLAKEERLVQEEVAATKLKEEELAKKETPKETIVTSRTTNPTIGGNTSSSKKYGVQIFALTKYSEQKVKAFCIKNGIDWNEISNNQTKGITKIRYGAVGSQAEAEELKKMLLQKPHINGAFVVEIKK